jgi:hypothetical protein
MHRDWADHRRSRCTIPRKQPLEWRPYIDENSEGFRGVNILIASLSDLDQEMLVGSILALRELAASGEIPENDEAIGPVRLDPEIYELRWRMSGALIRQYHAEPSRLPDLLVLLHIHQKATATESDSLTTELQDAEISYAALRYAAGEKSDWVA